MRCLTKTFSRGLKISRGENHEKKAPYETSPRRRYVAEVDVELIETDEGWSPYLSPEDAYGLDDVRSALRKGDLKGAARLSRVFSLTPVSA